MLVLAALQRSAACVSRFSSLALDPPEVVVGWSAVLVMPLFDIAERAGVRAERLLAHAGVSRKAPLDPSTRLSDEEYRRITESALTLSGDPLLGLHAGAITGPTINAAGHAAICAPTMRAALEAFFRYQPLLRDGPPSELHEHGDRATVVFNFVRINAEVDRVTSEAAVVRLLRGAQSFGDVHGLPVQVFFEHAPSASLDAYCEVLFGAEVTFGASSTRVEFPRAALDKGSRLKDGELFRSLCRHAERSLRLARKESLARDVQSVIQQGVAGTHPDTNSVARALGLAPQEFRRLLRERGYSFRILLDEARRALAEQLLLDIDVSVKDAAYSLGFSDPSAFNRAVRRWTGQTPLEYRRMRSEAPLAS
jgi:AraC-like DNA-binding protein